MTSIAKYPRISHLSLQSSVDGDDHVLDAHQRQLLLSGPVLVEEKLDGANVSIWFEGPDLCVASRGGPGAMDRAGILGRVRQWACEHADLLRIGLGQELVLYGEWLLLRHGVGYTRLPSPLVGLDLFDRATGQFLTVEERDEALTTMGVPGPPRLFAGVLGRAEDARRLIGRSKFGDQNAEGIIVRALNQSPETPRVAKLVRADFAQVRRVPTYAVENGVLPR